MRCDDDGSPWLVGAKLPLQGVGTGNGVPRPLGWLDRAVAGRAGRGELETGVHAQPTHEGAGARAKGRSARALTVNCTFIAMVVVVVVVCLPALGCSHVGNSLLASVESQRGEGGPNCEASPASLPLPGERDKSPSFFAAKGENRSPMRTCPPD
jgi:hypothetical protein